MIKSKFEPKEVICVSDCRINNLFLSSLNSPATQTCLNEYHLFFLLAGAFMGYSYSLLYFINNMNYLPFPIIQVR